jgi:hypothetical protein
MNFPKLMLVLVLMSGFRVMAQEARETYRFSNDIKSAVLKDTVVWKYQVGATDYSFNGSYKEAIDTWNPFVSKQAKISQSDSMYFQSFKSLNAKDYILNRSKKEEIIIINEAHHNSSHRVFTTSLLKGLYNNGYRFIGLEALRDSLINQRKFPIRESGYYIQEPQFGNLVTQAIKIGFTVFGYDTKDKNGKEREREQAENIARIIKRNPSSKFLIHCGYDHVIEGTPNVKSWEKAMAGRLIGLTKINPFTIDQVAYSENGKAHLNDPYIQILNPKESSILINDKGETFNREKGNEKVDCSIIHPVTQYDNGRPTWLLLGGKRKIYSIPKYKIRQYPALVLAYRDGEFDLRGIPADVIEVLNETQSSSLVLDKGKFEIIVKNKDYKITDRYRKRIH